MIIIKYVLYGLPCAGKTTLLNGISIPVIHGSMELNKMASGSFSKLPDEEKLRLRIRYAEQLSNRNDSFISDGHYSFLENIVFTESDGDLYDVFIYLYCEPKIISERLKSSTKNEQFAKLSNEHIRKWQDFEIESLRSECHKRNKDFYVVHDVTSAGFQEFIDKIENSYRSYVIAQSIVCKIMKY